MTKSVIDDLKADEVTKGRGGVSILFENPNIRKMLRLAEAGKDDIFCDMGCGIGQNLIIAASEFHVRKAVGFEQNSRRFRRAVYRIRNRGLTGQCQVLNEKFEKSLRGKSQFRLGDATIVFYGLETDLEVLNSLEERLNRECRLVYYNLCLFPEIMPNETDFPFYVSKFPFTKTTSELAWLQKVVAKDESSVSRGKQPNTNEMWDELSHDYKVSSNDALCTIKDYKNRMRKILAD
jgi:histone methylation protein DOT1